MQPNYDSWDYEPQENTGLSDISKGKGKSSPPAPTSGGQGPTSRMWDSATGKYIEDELPADVLEMMGMAPKKQEETPAPGSVGKGFDSFAKGGGDQGKGKSGNYSGGKGSWDGGKNSWDGGKSSWGGGSNSWDGGKSSWDSWDGGKSWNGGKGGGYSGKGGYDSGGSGKGYKGGSYDSSKGGYDSGKGGYDSGKGGYDSGKGGYGKDDGWQGDKGKGSKTVPPPASSGAGKGGQTQPGPLAPGACSPGVRGVLANRQLAPRMAAGALPKSGAAPSQDAVSLGNALAAVAGAANAVRPPTPAPGLLRPVMPPGSMPPGSTQPAFAPPQPPPHFVQPPGVRPPPMPVMGAPRVIVPGMIQPRGTVPPPAFPPQAPPMMALGGGGMMAPGLAPDLAALVSAGEVEAAVQDKVSPAVEKKPRILLLVTRLPPELEESHMQQLLEQCGEVLAWRRGRDPNGQPLGFGFAQFGDPEAAWKASTCLSKRVLCGQEIKILVEEFAENLIQKWRTSQKAALRVTTDEELDWELERKAVSCKALIDSKVEEIYGAQDGGAALSAGAAAQRRQELREKEQDRIDRTRKRKAWRVAEFARELERVEVAEKRLRREERDKDDADRAKELTDTKEKEEVDHKNAKGEDGFGVADIATPTLADNRALVQLVDQVQAEPRDALFKMALDTRFLRDEKIFEKKLRPWLAKKVDLCMGGPQSDVVEYILRRVNSASMPDTLISDLTRYMDEEADGLVERMWRMLAFELVRNGLVLSTMPKREMKKEMMP